MPGSKPLVRLAAWCMLVVMGLALSACSSSAERAAVCERLAGLENELSSVSQSLDDIATVSAVQLTNTFTVTLATLTTMADLGPSSLRDDFAVLVDVYESLAGSIESTGWNGEVAVSDPVVIRARAQLVSNDTVEARDAVSSYSIKNCSVNFGSDDEQVPGTPTTLSNPDVVNENAPDLTTGFDNENTIASSYGYYVAEQYNLAITNEQAICVGRALTEHALEDLENSDSAYTQLISDTLVTCGVSADISGS